MAKHCAKTSGSSWSQGVPSRRREDVPARDPAAGQGGKLIGRLRIAAMPLTAFSRDAARTQERARPELGTLSVRAPRWSRSPGRASGQGQPVLRSRERAARMLERSPRAPSFEEAELRIDAQSSSA
jgi:hypothetical protein